MLKKIIKTFIMALFFLYFCPICPAQDTPILSAEISMIPKTFYGTWRVAAVRVESDSRIFKENSLDIWNLSRNADVIKLCNPFNGAQAEVTINKVDENNVVFTKTGKYGKKVLTDIVKIKIQGNEFEGSNTLSLDTYEEGKKVKTETATYKLKGEKIAGNVEIE